MYYVLDEDDISGLELIEKNLQILNAAQMIVYYSVKKQTGYLEVCFGVQ